MIRRRKFLTKISYFNSVLLSKELILDNIYYTNYISTKSKNSRFFWRRITHLFKFFKYFIWVNKFSSFFHIFKKNYIFFIQTKNYTVIFNKYIFKNFIKFKKTYNFFKKSKLIFYIDFNLLLLFFFLHQVINIYKLNVKLSYINFLNLLCY